MTIKRTLLITSALISFAACPSKETTSQNAKPGKTLAQKEKKPETIKSPQKKSAPSKEYKASPIPFLAESGYLSVDDEQISPKKFNEKMELLGAFSRVIEPEQLQQFVDRTIEDLVNETLFRKTAEGQEIDAKRVDEKVEEIKSSTSNFEKHLEKLGQTEDELRQEVLDSMKTTAYVDSKIKITDADMQTFYKTNARVFRKAEQIRVSHIFFEVDDPKDKKVALKKANEVLKKVKEPGADFGELAKKYSAGPTKKKKGDLGWFSQKQLLPRFSKAAFRLKKGAISKPVWTERGYHIIKVFDKKPAETQSFKSVKPEIRKTLKAQKRADTIRDIIRKAKKDGRIKIDSSKIVKNPDFEYAKGIRKKLPKEIKVPKKN